MSPAHFQTVATLARRLRSGELSPVALAELFLERIAALDPRLGAFRLVLRERALAQARAAEANLHGGSDLGPLHGIPWVAKDLFDVEGHPTTAGTHLLASAIAGKDSAAVRRLDQAGMVLLGKVNTVQFAYGGVGINNDHGTPHNPWNRTPHVPGGSSSGTAVAVAAGLAPVGLGTDTGGSVRIPAALCGIVGLKTTVGRVSRAGVYPLSFSLDSVGVLARSVEDAGLVYQQLAGEDDADETTAGIPPDDALGELRAGVKGLRLAFVDAPFFDGVETELAEAVREAGHVLESLGAQLGSVSFPEAVEAQKLNPRGGVIAAEAYAVNRAFLEGRYDELDPVVRDRMRNGGSVTAPDYFEMTRRWTMLRRQARASLADVDALLVPTTLIPPLPSAPLSTDLAEYARRNVQYLRNTAIGNILGLCGLSVPCGFTSNGFPIGLMIYGKPFAERTVLRVGHAYEQATSWRLRTPDLSWATGA
ncbi:MAG TPA: amidase [Myxococcales bacterium]|nr:amidase [Myxococcales bacterium]